MISQFRGNYRFLSNFWPSPVTYEGAVYPTVEHAYQAAKTLDTAQREAIRLKITPAEAKRAGRYVTLRPDWDKVKVTIMAELIAKKFASGTPLAAQLAYTGMEHLEEGNNWGDTFWGVCHGQGRNELGKILMAQRSTLQQ